MDGKLKIVSDREDNGSGSERLASPHERLRVWKAMTASMMGDALTVWSKLAGELEDKVVCRTAILPEAQDGFVPSCGWPEFMENLWLLEHYLDQMMRLCEEPESGSKVPSGSQ